MRTTGAELISTLRRAPLFAELSENELSEVARRVTRRQYPVGAIIFTSGDRCRELLVVAHFAQDFCDERRAAEPAESRGKDGWISSAIE